MQSDVTVTQLLAFLNGEGEIEGRWFGDKDERGAAFWWRRYLPALADAQGEPVAWAYVNCDGECEEISWGASYLATMAGDPGITPLYAHPPAQDVAALVDHWRFLDKLIEDRIVETDQPDRVMWHGVWYDGPLATAYLETLRAIQKLARTALAKHERTPHDRRV